MPDGSNVILSLTPFSTSEGEWGYRKGGRLAIHPRYLSARLFCSGRAVVLDPSLGGYVYINEVGRRVTKGIYAFADDFDARGFSRVRSIEDFKYGFITKAGKVIGDCWFDSADAPDSHGFSLVSVGGKYGYFRPQSRKMVIEPKYDIARPFDVSGKAKVYINGLGANIDRKGRILDY